jgi:hypothetical protein
MKRFAGGVSRASRNASRRIAAFALAVLACHEPPGLAPVKATDFGVLIVRVRTTGRGRRVDLEGRDSLVVSLDSAIQGHGRQRLYVSFDSAIYFPVLVGPHETTVRGLTACTVVGGRDRTFRIDAGQDLRFTYEVHC